MYITGKVGDFEPRLHQLPSGSGDISQFLAEASGYSGQNIQFSGYNSIYEGLFSGASGSYSGFISGATGAYSGYSGALSGFSGYSGNFTYTGYYAPVTADMLWKWNNELGKRGLSLFQSVQYYITTGIKLATLN